MAVNLTGRPPGILICLALAMCFPAQALEVRDYSEALHNRLLHFPGAPVYQQTPTVNPAFSPSAALFLGIGWPADPKNWTRQMALVSPRHFICATHYRLEPQWRIAFLGTDGVQHTYGIQSQTPVVNCHGQTTDLMLCTLTNEVPAATGIAPFPVLNLPGEADYGGKQMIVCGSFVRAGTMPLHGFTTLANDPGFDTTRFAYFDYNKTTGRTNDCNYQGGDSGAPAFIMVNGKPALIGTASGQDHLPENISRNYINFIPNYLPELDLLMETQGYHIKRFYPTATTVGNRIAASGTLRRMKPGNITLETRNTGAKMAHNLSLKLTFSTAPTTVTGRGWICEAVSPTVWNCRLGGLASSTQATLTANWNRLPDMETLQISADESHDGGTLETTNAILPIS